MSFSMRLVSCEMEAVCYSPSAPFISLGGGGMRLSPLGTAAAVWPLYQSRMMDNDECGTLRGMGIGKEKGSTGRKPALEPLWPQFSRGTQTVALESQRPTTRAVARP
jgi:hypothetical protein